MNITLEVPAVEEGPSLGAAILAAVGCGKYRTVEEAASRIIKINGSIDPDPELVEKYEEKYKKFRKYYPLLKGSF